jgi:hypothetical protein
MRGQGQVNAMRVILSLLLLLIMSVGNAALACLGNPALSCSACTAVTQGAFTSSSCSYDAGSIRMTTPTADWSDFRGISLGSTPEDVKRVAKALGLEADILLYVGSTSLISGINIFRDCEQVATVSFDRHGRILRLSLKDGFFCPNPIFVRHFVEQVFERYEVKPVTEKDDVCFQDVTCFKGVSKFGEDFLIMRIGTTAELYVRP